VKRPPNPFLAIIFVLAFSALGFSSATNVYITPDGSSQGACTSSPQNPAWFNSASNWGSGASQIGPGTTVTICGTFTGVAGSTEFTFQGNGTSGSPITLLFDSGAVVQAPYFAPSGGGTQCGGAICILNRSYVTIDGGTSGIIQNTANGQTLTYQKSSEAIEGFSCSSCTVRNLNIVNMYIHPTNNGGGGSIDQTQVRAISMSGSNWTVNNNTIHDCGWCLFQAYGNNDTNTQIYNNNIYNMDHGWMLATGSSNSFTNAFFHDNQVHDTGNWDASGCPFHHDGIHTFGTNGSKMSGVYIYNNYFYGSWGSCQTGFIFIEGGGSSTPSHMQSFAVWNNVGIVGAGSGLDTNGWFGLFSGESGTQQVFNNTILGPNNSDNSLCYSMYGLSNLSFQNNVVTNCGDPVEINSSTFLAANVDHNFYGTSCGNGNNCFVWNNNFKGSFPNWKPACLCDSHGLQSNSALLNSDGSPQTGSPVIGAGMNLTSIATGILASLKDDTSQGDKRTPAARPPSGNWDAGAFLFGSGGGAPNPPTGLAAVVH